MEKSVIFPGGGGGGGELLGGGGGGQFSDSDKRMYKAQQSNTVFYFDHPGLFTSTSSKNTHFFQLDPF